MVHSTVAKPTAAGNGATMTTRKEDAMTEVLVVMQSQARRSTMNDGDTTHAALSDTAIAIEAPESDIQRRAIQLPAGRGLESPFHVTHGEGGGAPYVGVVGREIE